ncbi:thiamine transport system substrate-binding protein [Halogranum gelatinilyticum]|uniref:Thiamine transport system substrate-binding protein n=1 Tax=Halogranum gelatinilyticum TaxID=660521 RepID=A0A1G9NY68_9EURY|nr:thiamine ABC transporter substrate-binding protein [Halogranum gelatinilyticum]SDL90915.1 thiamine transport system substrate-binding protein [Halogranum gelatinilyticum]
MRRRTFLRSTGLGAAALVAGCTAQQDGSSGDGTAENTGTTAEPTGTTTGGGDGGETLTVATYSAFVDAPSSSPGPWLKEQFEAETDATIEWQTPENDLNYFIERQLQGVEPGADLYVGLDTNTLIRLDERLDEPLFAPVESGALSRRDEVKSGLEFDPQNRAVPYDTGYISLVYDENQATAPETFDGLLDPEFSGGLIAQNPTSSTTGRAFLLHTIKAKGEDGYLDYWRRLQDNDVRVLGTWSDAYAAYSNGEAPMVVSYSTDQVYANAEGEDLSEHQIRFLNGQGYANPEGMARFAASERVELANQFMDFVLRPEVQAEIAVRNVQFPATTTAELPESFAQYARQPEEPVTFTYEELKGNLTEWTDAWARQFASK